jgi:hypothetical protein
LVAQQTLSVRNNIELLVDVDWGQGDVDNDVVSYLRLAHQKIMVYGSSLRDSIDNFVQTERYRIERRKRAEYNRLKRRSATLNEEDEVEDEFVANMKNFKGSSIYNFAEIPVTNSRSLHYSSLKDIFSSRVTLDVFWCGS